MHQTTRLTMTRITCRYKTKRSVANKASRSEARKSFDWKRHSRAMSFLANSSKVTDAKEAKFGNRRRQRSPNPKPSLLPDDTTSVRACLPFPNSVSSFARLVSTTRLHSHRLVNQLVIQHVQRDILGEEALRLMNWTATFVRRATRLIKDVRELNTQK